MAGLSIDEVWDDARRFFVRERGLLLPLGFATFGLAALIGGLAIPAPSKPGEQLPPGPWMLALLPILALVLIGYLAVSRMALRSRISVAEALRDSLRLLPRAAGLLLSVGLVFIALSLLAGLVAGILATVAKLGPEGMLMLAVAIILPPAFIISIRLALIWPVLADRERPMRETFATAIAFTRGHAIRIAGLLIAYFMLYVLIVGVLESAVGSLFILLARILGMPGLAPILIAILMAAFNAVYMAFWTVFLARLYARLAGSTRGI
jgi:MFS family permease